VKLLLPALCLIFGFVPQNNLNASVLPVQASHHFKLNSNPSLDSGFDNAQGIIKPCKSMNNRLSYKATVIVGGLEVVTLRSYDKEQLWNKYLNVTEALRNLKPSQKNEQYWSADFYYGKFNQHAKLKYANEYVFTIGPEDAEICGEKLDPYVERICRQLYSASKILAPLKD
jgi:hypothetical protein